MNNDTPADAIVQNDCSHPSFRSSGNIGDDICNYCGKSLMQIELSRTTSLAAQDGLVDALRILAEEIAGIEQGDQEDLKLYLALLYHLQGRMAALASIEVKSHE